jgi:alkylation response protein AidB-like acyl-CoA dehydrogenase
MDFDFSDEQKELRGQAQRFLKEQCSTEVVREVLEGDAPYSEKLWKSIVEMGWTATALPEAYGGIGMGYLELCVIAEELGRVAAPVPFSSSVYLFSEAVLQAGSDEQKLAHLPGIAEGKTIGTFALAEGPHLVTAKSLTVRFEGGKLNGAKLPVPDGDVADVAVVLATSAEGPTLVLADLNAAGVSREAVKTIDPSRSHAKITFKDTPAEALGKPGEGWAVKDRVFDRAAILFAMEQLGGADTCLGMAQEYARDRYAFGRPIGSFQAIKHKLADMYIKNELARSNIYYAAWALDSGAPELPVAAAGARVAGTEAFHYASKENIQTHGGNGFTWEYDCHLFYRRAKLLSVNLGSSRVWKDRLITNLENQAA